MNCMNSNSGSLMFLMGWNTEESAGILVVSGNPSYDLHGDLEKGSAFASGRKGKPIGKSTGFGSGFRAGRVI